ncbi:hypothetical protein Bbelb_282510 [Branchiostoma belcheri]|nr:hypothetical protein Bbelb_282510 [Branchiostoma belcheri]
MFGEPTIFQPCSMQVQPILPFACVWLKRWTERPTITDDTTTKQTPLLDRLWGKERPTITPTTSDTTIKQTPLLDRLLWRKERPTITPTTSDTTTKQTPLLDRLWGKERPTITLERTILTMPQLYSSVVLRHWRTGESTCAVSLQSAWRSQRELLTCYLQPGDSQPAVNSETLQNGLSLSHVQQDVTTALYRPS